MLDAHTAGHLAGQYRWFVVAQPHLADVLRRAAAGEEPGVLMAELFAHASAPDDPMVRVVELDADEVAAHTTAGRRAAG